MPGASSYTDPTAHLAEAFDQYIELCEEDASCAALGDLRVAYSEGHQSYETSPATVVGDDGDGGKHDVFLDGDRLAQVIAERVVRPRHPSVARQRDRVARGALLDSLSADRVIAHNFAAVVPDFPWGVQLGGGCSYDVHTIEPGHELSSQALPELSGVDDGELEWMCAAWPVERLDDRAFDDDLAVDVPTLIVQGGITPTGHVDWGRQLASRTVTHATVVTFPTLGHNAMTRDQPPCLDEIRQSFIAQPDAPIDASDCEAASPGHRVRRPLSSGPEAVGLKVGPRRPSLPGRRNRNRGVVQPRAASSNASPAFAWLWWSTISSPEPESTSSTAWIAFDPVSRGPHAHR